MSLSSEQHKNQRSSFVYNVHHVFIVHIHRLYQQQKKKKETEENNKKKKKKMCKLNK